MGSVHSVLSSVWSFAQLLVEERLVPIVPSGGTVNVWNVTADGQKIFYYAEDQFGNIWGNDPNTDFFTQIPWQAFLWCWNTGSTTSRVLGLRKRIIPNPTPNGDWFFNLTA